VPHEASSPSNRNANTLAGQRDRVANPIEDETRFVLGCEIKQRREHDLMDEKCAFCREGT
jgi:hypothetical protein